VIEIRSFRKVFDLERRVYRVDSLRLNPTGVPVRGVVYFIATLCGALVLGRLPLVGVAVDAVPWYLRDLLLPAIAAALLGVVRVEGRPFHTCALTLLRYTIQPGCYAGLRGASSLPKLWVPDDVVMFADGSEGRMRRLRYTGPGSVIVSVEHERGGWAARPSGRRRLRVGPAITLSESDGGRRLEKKIAFLLADGARLLVRPPLHRPRPGR
jgi:hypothetical protein